MKYGTMKKRIVKTFGKKYYLLGKDQEGIYYWLEEPSWDCDWYWGFGYIETFTNNKHPKKSKDINSHEHADDFKRWCIKWNGKPPRLVETTFSKKEAWELCELFKRFYLFKELAEFYYTGSAGITHINGLKGKNLKEWENINKEVLPLITSKILEILTPKE